MGAHSTCFRGAIVVALVRPVVVGLAVVLASSVRADDDLDRLRSAHRSAREAIRTFSAEVTHERALPTREVVSRATYWRSLDKVRIRYLMPTGETHFLGKDSEVRQVQIANGIAGAKNYNASKWPQSNVLGLCDVWGQFLLDLYTPDGQQPDLDGFIARAKEAPRLKRARLDGAECVRLKMSILTAGRETEYALWFDIGKNYLVRKVEIDNKDGGHSEAENVEFIESPPGVFMPVRCVRRFRNGDTKGEDVTSLSNAHINEPIDDKVFQLPAIPNGTMLRDRIRGTSYRIDSQWRQIGPGESMPEPRHLAPPAPAIADDSNSKPTRSEPHSWTWWLVLGSLATLCVAGVFWYWRRRQSRASSGVG